MARVHRTRELVLHFFRDYFETLGVVLLCCLALRWIVISPYRASDDSMAPTVLRGDGVLGFKLPYGLDLPSLNFRWPTTGSMEVGDLVILRDPESKRSFLRRIIAVEGDRVQVREGRVFRNGERLRNELLPNLAQEPGSGLVDVKIEGESFEGKSWWIWIKNANSRSEELLVPPGQIFVLPDRREDDAPEDLRGLVPSNWAVAKLLARYSSPDGLPRILNDRKRDWLN